MKTNEIKGIVKKRYARAALSVAEGAKGSCCATERSASSCCADPITGNLYDSREQAELPEAAVLASLGCGNPTALAELKPGEVVLDLGSGGGIDVLLSAQRVGPTGKAYGLDMTDDMLALARENQEWFAVRSLHHIGAGAAFDVDQPEPVAPVWRIGI